MGIRLSIYVEGDPDNYYGDDHKMYGYLRHCIVAFWQEIDIFPGRYFLMKVFISGPMSGYEDFNRPAFMAAEKLLKDDGFDVFNPAWMDVGAEWTSKELLNIDICALSHCDAIFHLYGWERSDGAMFEHLYAYESNIPMIMYACKKPGHTEFEWFGDSTIYIPSDGKSTTEDLKVYMFGKGKKLTLTETSMFAPGKNIWFIARDKHMVHCTR